MKLLFIVTILLFSYCSKANNIVVSNVSLTGQNTTQDYTMIKFDLSWDNSWRVSGGPSNWDAAWVFAKYRLKTQSTWNHVKLNWVDGTGANDGHVEPANVNIASSYDNTADSTSNGVFIYSDVPIAQGSVSYSNIELRWEYGANGLLDGDSVEICVFAIEMVYVPQGGFQLGATNSTTNASFYQFPNLTQPYTISSEAGFLVGASNGRLYYGFTGYAGDHGGPVYSLYPKGFDAFYCMKYEVSQQQYIDFLNKLTLTQEANRFFAANTARHYFGGPVGNRTTQDPYIACNFISIVDLLTYLDWAALRPMSEFEYEKACRGVAPSVLNEFPWGNTLIANNPYSLVNPTLPSENIISNYSVTSGNALYSSTVFGSQSPIRCGIFAANANNTGRMTAGASYYGIMELGGNLREIVISIGHISGRAFQAINGDGIINSIGSYDVVSWPIGNGFGWRGGSVSDSQITLLVSNRGYGTMPSGFASGRYLNVGGRGVRKAP